jgi:RNA polymerase sigma-B factor
VDPYELDSLETIDIIMRAHEASDNERSMLEDHIVRRYMPMTRRLSQQYSWHGWDSEDLLQVANMSLVKAMRRFDPARGSFESYAKATISGELKNHLRDYSWSIKPPRRIQEMQSEIHRCTEELAQCDGTIPSTATLADHIGAPVATISEALSARSCHSPTSIDQPIGQAGRPLSESLWNEDEPYAEVDGHVALVQICTELNEDERNLIRLRFFEGLSQREIAEEIGVSQMQVSRRLTQVLSRLRSKALEHEAWAS